MNHLFIGKVVICVWLKGIYRVEITTLTPPLIKGRLLSIIANHDNDDPQVHELSTKASPYNWFEKEITEIDPTLSNEDIKTYVELLMI